MNLKLIASAAAFAALTGCGVDATPERGGSSTASATTPSAQPAPASQPTDQKAPPEKKEDEAKKPE